MDRLLGLGRWLLLIGALLLTSCAARPDSSIEKTAFFVPPSSPAIEGKLAGKTKKHGDSDRYRKSLSDASSPLSAFEKGGEESLLRRYAPVFVVEDSNLAENRIGTVVADNRHGRHHVSVDPEKGTVYTSKAIFSTENGIYTNLYYRVHFSKVPFSLFPFHLGAGKNVGLIVVATLNAEGQPVLYTLVHTCGCYLAFITTEYLPKDSWQPGWDRGRQNIYGERLPRFVDLDFQRGEVLVISLRSGTHRVMDVWAQQKKELHRYDQVPLKMLPFPALERLALGDGTTTSFYYTDGPARGYVKESTKIWERLFISWWALDWRVGEDKKLGRDKDDGIIFYTSLKPWARDESDMRDFAKFLQYWGWSL